MTTNGDYHTPSLDDVYEVRHSLVKHFPPEIASIILEGARYWPKVTCRAQYDDIRTAQSMIPQNLGLGCTLLTPRLSDWINLKDERYKIRGVRFLITSLEKDKNPTSDIVQGDSTSPYNGSHTWFEAAIVRELIPDKEENNDNVETSIKKLDNPQEPSHDEIPDEKAAAEGAERFITVKNYADNGSNVWHIQRNVLGKDEYTTHTVMWTDMDMDRHLNQMDEKQRMDSTGDGNGTGFVRALERNDRIAVMARGLFGPWGNQISNLEVELFYSV